MARTLVREAASDLGLGPRGLWDLLLATTEAVANAVQHGAPFKDHGFRLTVESCGQGLCVEVSDAGRFKPRLQRPGLASVHGRGLPIIAALSDHFEIEPGGRRTSVRFGKRLAA